MANKPYTEQELNEMRQLKKQGATYAEIGKMFNRTEAVVQLKFSDLGWTNKGFNGQPAVKTPVTVPPREKTLRDFDPRDMIRHLYNMGYRIENNMLVCIVRQKVNIKDILEG